MARHKGKPYTRKQLRQMRRDRRTVKKNTRHRGSKSNWFRDMIHDWFHDDAADNF